jgi:hypothetical protein
MASNSKPSSAQAGRSAIPTHPTTPRARGRARTRAPVEGTTLATSERKAAARGGVRAPACGSAVREVRAASAGLISSWRSCSWSTWTCSRWSSSSSCRSSWNRWTTWSACWTPSGALEPFSRSNGSEMDERRAPAQSRGAGSNSSSPSGEAKPSSGTSQASVGMISASRCIGQPIPISRAPRFLRPTSARS